MPRVVDTGGATATAAAHHHAQAAANDHRQPSRSSHAVPQQQQQQQQQQAGQPQVDPAMAVLLCTAGYDNTIRFWEAWSGICSRTIQHPESQINRLALSPDKRYLAAAGNTAVKLYDVQHQPANGAATAPIASLEGHQGNVTAVAWQNEGKWIVTACEDGRLKIWDPRSPKHPQRIFDHGGVAVNDCVIHPNQGELVSCDQAGAIKIWDLGGKACTHELMPEDDVPMRSVSVASDTSCLIGGNNKGYVYVWAMQHGRELTDLQPRTKFQAHSKYLIRCLLSPNVKYLATCSADKTIKIWNMEPHAITLDKTLTGHQRWVWDMAFSADSAYLVSASSDHYARLWELSTGMTVKQYAGHHKAAVCISLNDAP